MINTENTKTKKIYKKVKNILISQPIPQNGNSSYSELLKKHNVSIDFQPFIHIEGISVNEFRKSKINLKEHTAVIFTSRNSVDHFFRICGELRFPVSQETKYLCMTETIAHYLQKYILYRKRKVSFGDGTLSSFTDLLNKNKEEKFLFLCSDIHKQDIPDFLEKNNSAYTKAVIYRTVANDLSELSAFNYDMIVFFSPAGVKSLFKNFPGFNRKNIRMAAFGPATAKAIIDSGLKLEIKAPAPEAPSMAMALDNYLQKANK